MANASSVAAAAAAAAQKAAKEADRKAAAKAKDLLREVRSLAEAEARDTGTLAANYYVKKLGNAKYEVRNDLPYAQVVEEGRSAGSRRPPTESLRGWATRHGMLTGKESQDRGTLYVLARAIGQRGTPGKHLLARAKANLNLE